MAHPEYCDRYYECDNGQKYEVDCPNGLVFSSRARNALLDNCVYPFLAPNACLDKQLASEWMLVGGVHAHGKFLSREKNMVTNHIGYDDRSNRKPAMDTWNDRFGE